MLIGIFGGLGDFKTSLMSAFLRENSLLGRESWNNFCVDFPLSHSLDLSGLLSLGEASGMMGVDEIYVVAESRVSSSKLNRFFSYFIFQSRKVGGDEGLDVVYTSQLTSAVDKRLFDLTDLKIMCLGDNGCGVVDFIFCYKDDIISEVGIPVSWFEANVWGHYDTYQKINPLGLADLLVEVEKYDVDKINCRVDRAVEALFEGGCEYKYRFEVEDRMLRLGIPQSLGKFVWNRIQSISKKKVVWYKK